MQLREVLPQITDFWFAADARLDHDLPGAPEVSDEEALDRNAFTLRQNSLVPQELRERIGVMEYLFRENTYRAHVDFVKKFDPRATGFQDVLAYRDATTGAGAEMIGRVIAAVVDTDADVEPIIFTMRSETMCYQMLDDLIDCVADSRKGLPNLFNALLLEHDYEARKFWTVSGSDGYLHTRKPYAIVRENCPDTLSEYMSVFSRMVQGLPAERGELTKDFLVGAECIGYTPHTSTTATISEIRKVFRRGTTV